MKAVSILVLLVWYATASSATARPNVVVILADDLGAEVIDAYGGEYFTPNVDRLAREGQHFVNAHATPLCTPTRVRLMTARESVKNYRTFGNAFQAAGYKTAIAGKWHCWTAWGTDLWTRTRPARKAERNPKIPNDCAKQSNDVDFFDE